MFSVASYSKHVMVLRFLILAGCLTDQCVESAVRDACDKHYYVTLVTGDSILHAAQGNMSKSGA